MTIEKVEYNWRGKARRITALKPGHEEIYQRKLLQGGDLILRSLKVRDDESVEICETLSSICGTEVKLSKLSVLTRYQLNNQAIEKRWIRGRIRRTLFRYTGERRESPATI